ncbi:MAG: hypothetical protein H7Z40_14895 [Phycisphaerae bacterium]|nr:hypothetical protein [Gemmatimonadaceae bacterium]
MSAPGRARAGRALVECVVSMFLLAIVALATLANTRGTLALADDAALVTHAQALAVTRAEDALTRPCATTASGLDQLPRMNFVWQQSASGSGTLLGGDLTLDRSPIALAGNASMLLSLVAGGVCP